MTNFGHNCFVRQAGSGVPSERQRALPYTSLQKINAENGALAVIDSVNARNVAASWIMGRENRNPEVATVFARSD
jgi:hypothetical protein